MSIKDTGIGIDRQKLPLIFENFVQIEKESPRSDSGLGIGLGVVKTLVELHGGTIAAFSEGLGKGAEFVVRLPVAATKCDDHAGRLPRERRPGIRSRVRFWSPTITSIRRRLWNSCLRKTVTRPFGRTTARALLTPRKNINQKSPCSTSVCQI